MSGLRLATRSLRIRPTTVPALSRGLRIDGGAPGTGKWETSSDPNATESEADVRADQSGHHGKPDATLQHATAKEAEAEFKASQPITGKLKDAAKKVKDVLK